MCSATRLAPPCTGRGWSGPGPASPRSTSRCSTPQRLRRPTASGRCSSGPRRARRTRTSLMSSLACARHQPSRSSPRSRRPTQPACRRPPSRSSPTRRSARATGRADAGVLGRGARALVAQDLGRPRGRDRRPCASARRPRTTSRLHRAAPDRLVGGRLRPRAPVQEGRHRRRPRRSRPPARSRCLHVADRLATNRPTVGPRARLSTTGDGRPLAARATARRGAQGAPGRAPRPSPARARPSRLHTATRAAHAGEPRRREQPPDRPEARGPRQPAPRRPPRDLHTHHHRRHPRRRWARTSDL